MNKVFKSLYCALLLALVASFSSAAAVENAAVAAKVNGEPVQADEFASFANTKKSLVYDYFKKAHGIDPGRNFWKERFGNESPLEKLKNTTMQDLVKIKVEQIMAKEHGLARDIRYSSFLKEWQKENKRRKAAAARNEVLYGPIEYGELDYFNYVHSNQVLRLQEKLLGNEIIIKDSEYKPFYDSHPDLFRKKSTDKFSSSKDSGYEPMDKVMGKIRLNLIDLKYNQMVEDKVKNAKVEIFESIIDSAILN
jgi:hypothetical protein